MDSELLMAYLDGDLSPLERGRVAEHIVKCEACRTTVNDLRDVSDVLGRWEAPEPAGLPDASDLLARAGSLPEEPQRETKFGGLSKRWAAAAVLAAAASVIGLVSLPMFVGQDAAPVSEVAKQPGAPAETGGTQPQAVEPETPANVARLGNAASEPQPSPTEQPAEKPAAGPPDAVDQVAGKEEDKAAMPGGFVGTFGEAPKVQQPAEPERAPTQEPPPPPPPAPAITAEREEVAKSEAAPAAGARESRKRATASTRARDGATLIQRANLELAGGDAQALADRVGAVATGANGRVLSRSKLGRSGTVRLTLEVPVERFDEVYRQLKSLGTVTGETRWNNDISDRLAEIQRQLSDDAAGADDARRDRQSTRGQLESERVDLLERARKGTVVVTVRGPR